MYACFVDFRKAFDSVWHEGLFYKLLKTNIGGNLNNLMQSLYCNSTCSIKIGENKTQPFSYSRGVRQGCILRKIRYYIIPKLAFLPENRTANHVFTLRTLMDKYVHYHKEKVYACFVDFCKAFDCLARRIVL